MSNVPTMWSFSGHNIGISYGIGETEEQAARHLCFARGGISVAYERGILGGKGGWVILREKAVSEWWYRGEKLDPIAPAR